MIRSFADKEVNKIWFGIQSRKLPANIQNVARRKLRMINNAQNINDLRIPPANHLEKLSGNLEGFHSIRINKQWRIIFKWNNDNAFEVQIVDYH
ncbi:plasmid maintenance system killer family protein [Antarcticibacterium flavum]|uniref:Plasmid maintenance system killer family protein n=1 Tax=Antarcticibacterium flavum TaxID=2058175 RepID=A0A5B7X749_9FLAO|nr:type II toxin-antitoxin system RelE/ParE family toxin [Antarcticibacterium flavum]MCM4161746.1 plasmid maintenance system killer family protein [Antarcticibacterium sp. W02-3]QCY70538.1 plasmid maintenance system killer family protein [Antarcticibacterium flavum]